MRLGLGTLGLFVLLLTGCGGYDDNKPSAGDVPPPPIDQMLPPDYRVDEVLKANLTGGEVPETVVTAVGPPTGDLGLQPATVQVLSWDSPAKRWTVIFDAQKAVAPETYGSTRMSNDGPGVHAFGEDPTPILDPEANITLELVDFTRLLKDERDQLVLSALFNYGGSGQPQILAVVDFEDGKARILYAWRGEHLDLELDGDRILGTSSYWTRSDSHCCPSRDYEFVVGSSGGEITVLEDERPYLGVLGRDQGEYIDDGPLKVLEVAKGSPAVNKLRPGDLLLDVENTPPLGSDSGRPTLYVKIAAFDAGQTARLVISRGGVKMTIPVKLGSLKDAQTMLIPEDSDRVDAL